jgi:multidrug resistance efflux pump
LPDRYVPSRSAGDLRVRLRRALHGLVPLGVWLGATAGVVLLLRTDRMHVPIPGIVVIERDVVVAPADGCVDAVLVDLHQPVCGGQPLVRLADDDIRLRLAQARLQLERVRADLVLAEVEFEREHAGLRARQQLDEGVERRRLASTLETAQVDALMTRAEIEEARVRLQGAQVEVDSLSPLAVKGMLAETELIRQTTERDALQTRIKELQAVEKGQQERIAAAQRRLAGFRGDEGREPVRDPFLDPLRVRLREQENEIERLVLLASKLVLTAPGPGRVESVGTRAGSWVRAGQELLVVCAPEPRRIVGYVPDAARSQIAADAGVRIVDRTTQAVLGETRIRSISPALVVVPRHLWRDPAREEHAWEIVLPPIGSEIPGGFVSLVLQ